MRRTSARPGLPHEIVRDISRLSQLVIPMFDVVATEEIAARATSQDPVRRLWFESRPFTSLRAIDRIAAFKLVTQCQHQGWVSMPDYGSWSWFEVAILTDNVAAEPLTTGGSANNSQDSGVGRVKNREDGTPLRWISHKIPVDQSKSAHLEGPLFDADHEVFSHLEVGDSIGVFACARFGAWECVGLEGKLALEMFFEPLSLFQP